MECAMLPATDLSVWLETSVQQGMTTLIPYVRSAEDLDLHYDVKLTTSSSAGTSSVVQGGNVRVLAGQPHRLSLVTTKRDAASRCLLSVSLSERGTTVATKQYECGGADAQGQ
ncbi:curli-like amyloid fiber formation chaperone CsgH [Caballeronia sp.]|uniref:curli-like amyloid fiber formation chaperone CsgH n=1 Tax=Caballeronia sp. TaxID=1931223 RepID=UPI003C702771